MVVECWGEGSGGGVLEGNGGEALEGRHHCIDVKVLLMGVVLAHSIMPAPRHGGRAGGQQA